MNKSKLHIPEHAQCVFKGETYETWQREQTMYDGRIKIFEKVRRLNEVTIIAIVDNKIVVQRQEQPHREAFISLPGGRCEEGENPLETARRELLEETGYVADNIFLRKTIPSAYSSVVREAYYFIAQGCKTKEELNLDGGEIIDNRLINFDEFLMLSENENFRDNDLTTVLLRMRVNPQQKTDFYTQLFG